jgi:hypothetical protein
MTHEVKSGDEATGGPQNDPRLPPATATTVTDLPGAPDEDVPDDGERA